MSATVCDGEEALLRVSVTVCDGEKALLRMSVTLCDGKEALLRVSVTVCDVCHVCDVLLLRMSVTSVMCCC